MIISDAVKDRDEIKQDGGPETNMSSGEGGRGGGSVSRAQYVLLQWSGQGSWGPSNCFP